MNVFELCCSMLREKDVADTNSRHESSLSPCHSLFGKCVSRMRRLSQKSSASPSEPKNICKSQFWHIHHPFLLYTEFLSSFPRNKWQQG